METDMRKIVQYETKWSLLYQMEKEALLNTLKDFSVDIEHIGSTSVPGLAGSPIVDILIGVKREEDINEVRAILKNKSHVYVVEKEMFVLLKEGVPAAHYPPIMTAKNARRLIPHDARRSHVYVTVSESPYWNERINFREQLRSSERARKKYEGMKYELSKRLWNDISTYEYKKEEFIQRSL